MLAIAALTTAPGVDVLFGGLPEARAQSAQRAVLPVRVNGKPAGQIVVQVPGDGVPLENATADALELRRLLEPHVVDGSLPTAGEGRRAVLRDLRELGLDVRVDERTLELSIEVPIDLRRVQAVPLERRMPDLGENPVPPSAVSGFMNFFGAQAVTGGAQQAFARAPFTLDSDGALQIKSWVAEGEWTFREGETYPLYRRDLRVVKDFPATMNRFTAGDLNYDVTGFQQFRPMAGLSFARNFETQPYRLTIPTASRELVLRQQSTINVYVNDRQSHTLSLPAGRYDLRDLPLLTGRNDVRFEIVDAAGRIEDIRFSAFSDPELLSAGLHQYSYGLGLPSEAYRWTYRYDRSRPTATALHRFGASRNLTLGANFQGDLEQSMLGTEFLTGTPIGVFLAEITGSKVYDGAPGWAGRLRYLVQEPARATRSQRALGLSFEHRSPHFAQLGQVSGETQLLDYDISAQYSQDLFLGIGAGVAGNYSWNRPSAVFPANSFRASLNLTRRWLLGLYTNAILQYSRDAIGRYDRGALLLLTWSMDSGAHLVNLTADTSRASARADWRYRGPGRSNRHDVAAGVEHGAETSGANAQWDYIGNRGRVSLLGSANARPGGQFSATSYRSEARFASALVFAGDRVALSRPVTNAFVIVDTQTGWKGQELALNPNADGAHEAQANWLGGGVLPDGRPYEYGQVLVDTSKLPQGVQLEREYYIVQPTYKSGTVIAVASRSAFIVRGKLVDASGNPISLRAGRVKAEGESPGEFFTDRQGRFQIDGLGGGLYSIFIASESGQEVRVDLEVPEPASRIVDVGTVRVEGGRK